MLHLPINFNNDFVACLQIFITVLFLFPRIKHISYNIKPQGSNSIINFMTELKHGVENLFDKWRQILMLFSVKEAIFICSTDFKDLSA